MISWNNILPRQAFVLISALSVDEIRERLLNKLPSEYKVGAFSILGKGRISSYQRNGFILIEDVIPRHKTSGKAVIQKQNGQSVVNVQYIAGSYFSSLALGVWFIACLFMVWAPIILRLFAQSFGVASILVFIFSTAFISFPVLMYIHTGRSFIKKLHKRVVSILESETIYQVRK